MAKKIFKILIAITAILVGLYPFIYFFIDRKFGLLQSKSEALLNNFLWNTGFYVHIILGGIALLIGWTQFGAKRRNRNLKLHRQIGKVYVVAALLSALSGIYIGFFSTGGIVAAMGFICLGIVWFFTTLKAYTEIKNSNIIKHQEMMIYSYAACFSAVTLRIYLPLLVLYFNNFNQAYVIVAWLCWVPNVVVAYFLVKKSINKGIPLSINLTFKQKF